MISKNIIFYNMQEILVCSDWTRCVMEDNSKLAKRSKRVRLVCDVEKIITADLFRTTLVAKFTELNDLIRPSIQAILPGDIERYLGQYSPTHYSGQVVEIKMDPEVLATDGCGAHCMLIKSLYAILIDKKKITPGNPIKRAIEAELTASLNIHEEVYNISCKYFKLMARALCDNNPHIMELVERKKIIFEFKGSVQVSRTLKVFHPEKTKEIEELFSNSDNDTSVLIDPKLPNFDDIAFQIRTELLDLMEHYCDMAYIELYQYLDQIQNRPIQLGNKNYYPGLVNAAGFIGTIVDDILSITYTKERCLRVCSNELKFVSRIGCLHNFYLLRWKVPVKLGNRTLFAELLDISIPKRNECKLAMIYENLDKLRPIDMI